MPRLTRCVSWVYGSFRLRHLLRPHRGSKALGAPDRACQTSLLYWGSGDQVAVEALWQRQVFKTLRQQVLPADPSSEPKSEIVRALETPGVSPLAVLYLYCTCAVGRGNEPVLRFGATSDTVDVIRQPELGSGGARRSAAGLRQRLHHTGRRSVLHE